MTSPSMDERYDGIEGQAHTPEPWRYDANGVLIWRPGSDRDPIMVPICEVTEVLGDDSEWSRRKANARRIVACVNACKGITFGPNGIDANDPGWIVSQFHADESKLREQDAIRAELVRAINALWDAIENHEGCGEKSEQEQAAVALAVAALKKAGAS